MANAKAVDLTQALEGIKNVDELQDLMGGKTGIVKQPGKGVWLDKAGHPARFTVVGVGEKEDGVFVLKLESIARMERFKRYEQQATDGKGMQTIHVPDGHHAHAAQVVPNCPPKWFRPD